MDNTPDTTPEDELSMSIKFHNGDTMTLQQVVHGMHPMIMIRPEFEDDSDTTHIIIDATGPSSLEELAEFFDMMAQMVRAGEITSYNHDQAEEN